MSLYFHGKADLKFQHQYFVTRDYIIPFIEKIFPLSNQTEVLEIGCGEGGVLMVFAERNCYCHGIDLSQSKIEAGKKIFAESNFKSHVKLDTANIYDDDFHVFAAGRFDLIILKDTIEHIPQQQKAMERLKEFLKPDGAVFFAFPPWRMPFGGHQQICNTKLGKLPWIHLLPRSIYKAWMKKAGESDATIHELLDIYDTRISIHRFEQIARKLQYQTLRKRHYLVNPIYRYKFKWTPREQNKLLSYLPWIRDFFTTTVYYLLRCK
jgi:SAM-dependent methyltransferase